MPTSRSSRYPREWLQKAAEDFRPLVQQVTGYYLIERYPTVEEGPTNAEVRSAYQQTQRLVRRLRRVGPPRRR